jgi:hypothetical protein
MRLSSIGNRGSKIANTTEEGNFGFKGNFGDSSWNWDAHFSYGKSTVETQSSIHQHRRSFRPSAVRLRQAPATARRSTSSIRATRAPSLSSTVRRSVRSPPSCIKRSRLKPRRTARCSACRLVTSNSQVACSIARNI